MILKSCLLLAVLLAALFAIIERNRESAHAVLDNLTKGQQQLSQHVSTTKAMREWQPK